MLIDPIHVSSKVFSAGGAIPPSYTCDGNDVFPPLEIRSLPEGVVTLALVMDDPDSPSGTWDHVILFNIKPDAVFAEGMVPEGIYGTNSWGRTDWGGPCPGDGVHRYFFKVYALNKRISLKKGASKSDLLVAMEGHIIGYGELMGTYARTSDD